MSETMRIGGRRVAVLKDRYDLMEVVIRCPNCGKPAKYGKLQSISGYVGCNNKIYRGIKCFEDDLAPRVEHMKKYNYELYRKGINVYHLDRERKTK